MTTARRILIVDDDEELRETLKDQLVLHDEFEVLTAGTASKGMELAKGDHFDLLVYDVSLPDMDGIHLISMLRDITLSTRFVVLTTRTGSDDITRSLNAGAHAYLFKDTPAAEILAALRMVAEGGRYVPPSVGRKAEELPRSLEITRRERRARP